MYGIPQWRAVNCLKQTEKHKNTTCKGHDEEGMKLHIIKFPLSKLQMRKLALIFSRSHIYSENVLRVGFLTNHITRTMYYVCAYEMLLSWCWNNINIKLRKKLIKINR